MDEQPLKESQLEVIVDAALGGRTVGVFEPVDIITFGYQVRCQVPEQSASLSLSGEELVS